MSEKIYRLNEGSEKIYRLNGKGSAFDVREDIPTQ